MKLIINRIKSFIAKNNLLSTEGKHLLALSGGADSVALLLILKELGYNIDAAHCNFHLRGEESNRDEFFCKNLCQKLNIKLHVAHFNAKDYCRLKKISIEMGARELRYNYFYKLLNDIHADRICVAHHKNDCAETFLMNIIRGTGITGLTSIRPQNGKIVRPLLCVTREEIENLLNEVQQDYITDSTNLVNDVLRNKIRLDILPLLKEINPSVIESLASTAEHVQQTVPLITQSARQYTEKITSRTTDGIKINLKELFLSPTPQFLFYSILVEYNISSAMIKQIFCNIHANTGKSWETDNVVIALDRGFVIIEGKQTPFVEIQLPDAGNYFLSNNHQLKITYERIGKDFKIDNQNDVALLDADTVMLPLKIRRVKECDYFIPLGMNGKKLLSDFLTDKKLSILEKRRQLCVTDADNNIVWVVGLRINNINRITEKTIKIIRLRYI